MSADGPFVHPLLPFSRVQGALRSQLGSLMAPGGEVVAYVRGDTSGNRSVTDGDSDAVIARLYPTLNAALALCRSGRGDIVVVLPGHAEYIASADQMSNLVAGTKIIGVGAGTVRPTFRFTATGSTFLLDVANVEIHNCIFDLCHTDNAGVTVAAPFTVSAAGCGFHNCLFRITADANDRVTIAINVGTAGDYFKFIGNRVVGSTVSTATADCVTTFLRLNGADYAEIVGNSIICSCATVTIGPIQMITTASLGILMVDNFIFNTLTTGSSAVVGLAGTSGFIDRLYLQTIASHTDFEVIGDANGCFSGATTSCSFGIDVYASGDVAQRMAPLTPQNS